MKKSSWMLSGISTLLLLAGCGFENRVPIEMTSMNQVTPWKNLCSTIADIGSLEITSDRALFLDLDYDKAATSEVKYDAPLAEEGRFVLISATCIGQDCARKGRAAARLAQRVHSSQPENERGRGDARLFDWNENIRTRLRSGLATQKSRLTN
jgi:hypothetical protein